MTSPHPRPIAVLGYTTRRHLILDLDNSGLPHVLRLVSVIMKAWEKVGDCLVLESSTRPDQVRHVFNKWGRVLVKHDRPNHHVVFDNGIGYDLSCRICSTLGELGVLNPDYAKIRQFRGDMTLRVGPSVLMREIKPVPREVAYVHNPYSDRADGYIREYQSFKKIGELLALGLMDAEGVPGDRRDGSHHDA